MDLELDGQLRFLRSLGTAETRHSHTTLLAHLMAVRGLLSRWGARPALVTAGLFHSVYGTEFFGTSSLGFDQRPRVRARIGREAEEIAFLWCRLRRETLGRNLTRDGGFTAEARDDGANVDLSPGRLHDLVNLWCADTCEQIERLSGGTRHQATLYGLRVLALPAAREAVEATLGPRLSPAAT